MQSDPLDQFLLSIDWGSFIPLLVAMVLGGVIGLEREIHHKAAGLRTIILICTGAALFTIVARSFGGDNGSTRVIQGVITGVGFIGAGAIIRDRASVHGITTAATIWMMTGIGIACGLSLYEIAIGVTVLSLIVLGGLSPLNRKIKKTEHEPDIEE